MANYLVIIHHLVAIFKKGLLSFDDTSDWKWGPFTKVWS